MQIVGKRIDELRKRRGWSKGQLLVQAKQFRPSLSRSSMYEVMDEERNPSVDMIGAFASALGTTVSYLTGETDDPAPKPINNHIRQRRIVYETNVDERLLALWRGLSAEKQRAVLDLLETMQEKIDGRIIGDAPEE